MVAQLFQLQWLVVVAQLFQVFYCGLTIPTGSGLSTLPTSGLHNQIPPVSPTMHVLNIPSKTSSDITYGPTLFACYTLCSYINTTLFLSLLTL